MMLAIILFGVQNCKDSSNPVEPLEKNFLYPLKVNNQWNYDESYIYSNFRPDSIKYHLPEFKFKLEVSVTKDTILNSLHLFEVKKESVGSNFAHYSYYLNNEDGFIKYAERQMLFSEALYKKASKRFLHQNKSYGSIQEIIREKERSIRLSKKLDDRIRFLKPPQVIYIYPLHIGQKWTKDRDEFYEVIRKENVKTSFGTFECYVITNSLETDNGTIYNEYVGAKGLIKKEIIIKDVVLTTAEYPDGIGICDLKVEQVLTDVNF